MSFYTGTATTVSSLLTALQNACTDNGWTVSGNLIYKNDCVMEVSTNGNGIQVIGGTGQDNGSLTGDLKINTSRRMAASLAGICQDISYPLTYNLHVFNEEVYLFVNFNVDSWSYIAFGQSPVSGISGTGNWYGGVGTGSSNYSKVPYGNKGTEGGLFSMLFGYRGVTGTLSNTPLSDINCFFHHGLDGQSWSCAGETAIGIINTNSWSATPSQAAASWATYPLMSLLPNAYNSEAVLLPITPCVFHKDTTTRVIVGDLRYARYTRIDNYEPGQIITIGDKKYKVYPWLKKNSSNRDGTITNSSVTDAQCSGTYGVAILYDGD